MSRPADDRVVFPVGPDGLRRRVLLEVALGNGNFKIEIAAKSNDALYDSEVLARAFTRAQQYVENVIRPEAHLREQWRIEDAAREAENAAGDVPLGAAEAAR